MLAGSPEQRFGTEEHFTSYPKTSKCQYRCNQLASIHFSLRVSPDRQAADPQAIAVMVSKSRTQIYGKRRCNNLLTAFDNLNISPAVPSPSCKVSVAGNERSPFKAVSHNLRHSASFGNPEQLGDCQIPGKEDTPISTSASPRQDCRIKSQKAHDSSAYRGQTSTTTTEVCGVDKKARLDDLRQEGTQAEPQQPHSVCVRRGRKPRAAKAEVHEPDAIDVVIPTRSRRSPKIVDRDQSGRPSPPTSANFPAELTPLLALPYISTPAPLSFSAQYAQWARNLSITKVAQGSYASILRLALPGKPSTYTIWKLMPLKPRHGKGSRMEGATCIDDAIAELRLLEAMSKTPGFVEFRSAMVLQGVVPKELKKVEKLWRDEEHIRIQLSGEAQDVCEEDVREYGPEQLWLFVEMSDAGEDVEKWLERALGIIGPREVWDLFWGTVEAVAQGEAEMGFEHRDLHLGNICVKKRKLQHDSLCSESSGIEKETGDDMIERSAGEPLVRRFTDLEVTLIDYTLSRASIAGTASSNDRSGHATTPASPSPLPEQEEATHAILANSMRDDALFSQDSKDPLDQLQYDTYRHMRDIMLHHYDGGIRKPQSGGARRGRRPKVRTEDQWKKFMPATNLLWLHHVLVVLMLRCGGEHELQQRNERGAKSEGKPEDVEGMLILQRLKEVKTALWKSVEVAMGRRGVTCEDEGLWESAINVLESQISRQGNVA